MPAVVDQLVVGPDVEQLLVDYLPDALASYQITCPVGTKARSAESVTLYRTGGAGMVTRVSDEAQITFDVRASSEARAARWALYLRAIVNATQGHIISGVQLYQVRELAGPANLPDPNYTGARYRWSVYIHASTTIIG